MNLRIHRIVLLALLCAGTALGAFQKPSQEELEAAAEQPSLVVELVKDANPDQAAEVGKDVIIEIIRLDLEPEERDQRITELIAYLFAAMPDDTEALAISLGRFVAASPTASMSPEIVSAIQRAIILAMDVEHGRAFGNAYNLAKLSIAGAPGGGKTVPPQPPPPPVALPYEVQRLP